MHRLFVLALLGSSAFGLQVAQAADFIPTPPPVIVEEKPDYSGWYIRGDVGYLFESKTDLNYRMWDSHDEHDSRYHFDRVRHQSGFTAGAGVGYRVATHFRTDLSADYYSFDTKGESRCPRVPFRESFAYGYGGNDACTLNDTSSADVWTVMANAYVDLPYFGMVTPYFGAGIGAAHVSYGEMRNVITNKYTGEAFFEDKHQGENSWRFASSLMAGASIDITRNLALDAGYRYTRVFSGDAFGFDTADIADGATGVQSKDNGFNIHALRAGLRYSFF